MEVDSLIKQICQNWNKVLEPPTDRNRWDKDLRKVFNGYDMFNGSDLQNYGKCYSYEVLAHKEVIFPPKTKLADIDLIQKSGGHIDMIFLELSAVLPYYLVSILRKTVSHNEEIDVQEIEPDSPKLAELLLRAEKFAEERGFTKLPRDWMYRLVPGAELENAEPGTVTIYNCLFEDLPNWSIMDLINAQNATLV